MRSHEWTTDGRRRSRAIRASSRRRGEGESSSRTNLRHDFKAGRRRGIDVAGISSSSGSSPRSLAQAARFVFLKATETTVALAGRDTIFDFSGTAGDRIDLQSIDAKSSTAADDAFTFIGTAKFSKVAGQLRYEKLSSDTYIYGDVNGDGTADFAINLDDAVALSKGLFLL